MNAYEIIKDGLNNEDDDSKIIDQLQEEFLTSQIENNIFIIEETKSILEPPLKSTPTEMESNHFLVKSGKNFVDVDDGRIFKEYKEKTYSACTHGLCKKLNTSVLKNIVKNSHSPSVFYAITKKPKENKNIRIKYQNENKKQQVWEFTSQEINECQKCIDDGLSNKQIAVHIFSPKECIQKLIAHIDINQKIDRSRNGNYGNDKKKNKSSVGRRQTNRKTRRENRSNNF